jgi:hypothetical protein
VFIAQFLETIKSDLEIAQMYPEEKYYGPTEYKRQLTGKDDDRLVHLITQMRFRLGVSLYS